MAAASSRVRCLLAAALVTPALAPDARADAPPIKDNGYSLELYQGPVIAPGRVLSVGGAYTALAEGVEGVAANAASPAIREPWSRRWFDFDMSVGFSLPGAYGGTDFNNRGEKGAVELLDRTNRFLYANLGLRAQVGSFGATLAGDLLQYDISPAQGGAEGIKLNLARAHADIAYGFWENQLALGVGIRIVTVQLTQGADASPSVAGAPVISTPSVTGTALLTTTGAGPEIGGVLKPDGLPWRVGATVRAPVTTTNDVQRAGSFIVPGQVVQPWEIEAGVAVQLGPRPLNPRWRNPRLDIAPLVERIEGDRAQRAKGTAAPRGKDAKAARAEEDAIRAIEDEELAAEASSLRETYTARYTNWPRERLLILASVLFTGASSTSQAVASPTQAVALEGFLDQKREVVGTSISVAPRLGIEGEPLADRARLRTGAYIEPSRFTDGTSRQHFTFGGDVKLFAWEGYGLFPGTTWQASAVLDLAPRYQNYGVGVSAWH